MQTEILRLENIRKSYGNAGVERLLVLDGVDLTLHGGEIVSITGKSGCGKSTLLGVAALLSRADDGKIFYDGKDASLFAGKSLAKLRNEKMGFVFQDSMLLGDFNALENVAMPLLIRGMNRGEAYDRARAVISEVGMYGRLSHRPGMLSGGERQRIAIARALVAEPRIIFADEPTGALDERSAAVVEDLLLESARDRDRGVVIVTHDRDFAMRCDSMYTLTGGVLS